MDITLCRICCENTGITDIFDESHGVQLSQKIMYCCANVHISHSDGLPTRICQSCEEELSSAYRFILKCEATNSKFRSCIFLPSNYEFEPKQEIKDEETYKENPEDNYETEEWDVETPMRVEDNIKSENFILSLETKKIVKPKVGGKQTCKVCGKECDSPSALAIHMRKHSEHRPFKCTLCDKKYKDGGGLKRHIERNHNNSERKRKFMCETCGKAFYSKSDVTIHMRTHTGETPYACNMCPLKFTQIGALLRHQVRHTGERTHECLKCNKKFLTKEGLKQHQDVHSNEKKYICTTCNIPFKYKNNLRKHTRLHSTTNKFICNHCGRTFNAKGNLKKHINHMHSNRSGFCNTCSKNVPDVEVHMWRHNGKRPLKCELCSSTFYEKKSLTRHLNFRHKNSDKYKCSTEGCIVSFPTRPMLEFHMAKFHGSSVPFPCDGCSRGFYRKTDLARHKIRNHGET